MRNALPLIGPRKFDSNIVKLDNKDNSGMHWIVYKKVDYYVKYFDSFYNL